MKKSMKVKALIFIVVSVTVGYLYILKTNYDYEQLIQIDENSRVDFKIHSIYQDHCSLIFNDSLVVNACELKNPPMDVYNMNIWGIEDSLPTRMTKKAFSDTAYMYWKDGKVEYLLF